MHTATSTSAQNVVDHAITNRQIARLDAMMASSDLCQAQNMSHYSIAIADFAGMIRSELDMDAARKALIDANVAVRLATDRAFDMGRVASFAVEVAA